eukprot:SAG31_NODE_8189_length_1500_cov_1.617416_1_plen_138_part_00
MPCTFFWSKTTTANIRSLSVLQPKFVSQTLRMHQTSGPREILGCMQGVHIHAKRRLSCSGTAIGNWTAAFTTAVLLSGALLVHGRNALVTITSHTMQACKKPLPRCAVCLQPLDCANPTSEDSKQYREMGDINYLRM